MTEAPPTILAFDIGIRNLAWCLMRAPSAPTGQPTILSWRNFDLLTGEGAEARAAAKTPCTKCSAKASFNASGSPFCLRHCPAATPPLKDLSGGTVYKKLPAVAELRALAAAAAAAAGLPALKKTAARPALLEFLQTRHALPIERVKVKKAVEHDLALIHDAIRKMVTENLADFRQATQILLENQPVLKNPTMKTVQILLFATLRDLLVTPPPLKLVHAGKKVKVGAKGDAGYKDRKDASEAAARALLKGQPASWLQWFDAQAKRSDLADALCMCCDALGIVRPAAVATPRPPSV
jgi:hypothetical protein